LGVWIPTLCHHPAVADAATCRVCMVELDRGDWKQLVTACNYPVRRDLAVSVSSEAAVAARRGVMELLLARAPDNEQLRALGERMGVEGTPYPTVSTTQRDCILCGLCTAVCEEVIGAAAIGFAGRGADRAVSAPFRQASEDCIGCGACAFVCPGDDPGPHPHGHRRGGDLPLQEPRQATDVRELWRPSGLRAHRRGGAGQGQGGLGEVPPLSAVVSGVPAPGHRPGDDVARKHQTKRVRLNSGPGCVAYRPHEARTPTRTEYGLIACVYRVE
ncbi:hypothetical protein LCGC14_1495040, partial [marine sediment metagenome]